MAKWIWLLTAFVLACERPSPPTQDVPRSAPTASASATVAAGIHYELRYSGKARATDKLVMIVAIHGLGDRPEGFGALLSDLPLDARVVLPRGTSPHGSGYSWFPIDIRDPSSVAPGVERAAKELASMIDGLVETHPTLGKPIVTGFSQGGMLSFALATHYSEKIGAAVPIAGWLPAPLLPARAPDKPVRIVALHGDADPLLPIESTRTVIGDLRRLGFPAELHEYPGVPHNVSPAMRRDLFRELVRAAAEQR
ncbi:MAG TPA: dienelactone hydrolase family protein [Polyangiaceae bacterium]|nr:dienelactone hydrolase family protein [Polyangiaceae bacterium]